ncbi:ROK family protein [Streptacidiphilus sp. ASG 303]|uniref:ROK family protein n=1 Tax=Streptacidiphilus sp. ASG 303 TaxID=2896847 RepID=UPI001E369F4D|nr:ROK family protein [Streptacidiphilus sp. ASG 303]MCD0483794.1 ROK family protein [Streptacidiphilus sp. ASG 303]
MPFGDVPYQEASERMQTERTGTAAGPATTPAGPAAGDAPGGRDGGGGLVAALDIGGTKIAGALVDLRGALVARSRRPTPATGPGEAVMGAVAEVLEDLAAAPGWERVRGVGIGSAGPVDAARGTVSPVNIGGWRDFPLVERVRRHPACGGLPVVLVGDGVAMTAAEHWQGAARGHDNALCMVVSTGVGGGLVLGGALHTGPSGNAGHIGHISVDLDGEPCPCGARGCVEGIASGTAIARRALRDGWRPAGADATAAAVAAAARTGDPVALAAFDRAARALAAGIAATATLVEVDVAVVGGGVAQAGEVLFAPLRERLAEYAVLPFVRHLEVRPALLGNDAGLVGAAAAVLGALGLRTAAAPG